LMADSEGIALEPSALAGAPGIARVMAADQADYRARMGLSEAVLAQATHVVWATGGSMVPAEQMAGYRARGEAVLAEALQA